MNSRLELGWRNRVGMLVMSGLLLASGAGAENSFFRLVAPSNTAITRLDPDGTLVWSNAVLSGTVTVQIASESVTNWQDCVQDTVAFTVQTNRSNRIVDANPPTDMSFIPAGSFQMGDTFAEDSTNALPVHSVYISAFYMDKYEVTKTLWDDVKSWATANGYSFDYAGSGKAANHPVQTIDWYDMVKWCNARSQKAGLTPCYTVGGSVYKTGQSAPDCNWSANGYRLPTEAEWEKAARGGSSGQRFTWGNTIDHSRANYYGNPSSYAYDLGYSGYDTNYITGGTPYTSPVGCFSANGYGLYDMAGNVWEWCWDRYAGGYYSSSPGTNPRGASSGTYRVLRGGGGTTTPATPGARTGATTTRATGATLSGSVVPGGYNFVLLHS